MRKAALVPFLLALAACGGDAVSPPPEDLVGRWNGSTSLGGAAPGTFDFALTFTQDGGDVGGTGRVRFVDEDSRDSADVSLDGRFRDPELVFTLARDGFAPLGFNGRIFRTAEAGADSVVGTLSGSGFAGQRLRLVRAEP